MDQEKKGFLRAGVRFALLMSCMAVATSMGAVVVSGSRLAGTLEGLAVVIWIGLITGLTFSYSLFRAESGQAQPFEEEEGENRGDQRGDEADEGGSEF